MQHTDDNSFAIVGYRCNIYYDSYEYKQNDFSQACIDKLWEHIGKGLVVIIAEASINGSEHLETDQPVFVGLPLEDIKDDETLRNFKDRVKALVENLIKKNPDLATFFNMDSGPEVVYGY